MVYRHAIDATTYVFNDLRDLLAKATPPRSGDRLAGIAADSAEAMIAARIALADVPLKQFLRETVIPYEDDEVTRLIVTIRRVTSSSSYGITVSRRNCFKGTSASAILAAIIASALSAAIPARRSPERGGVALARRSRRSSKT